MKKNKPKTNRKTRAYALSLLRCPEFLYLVNRRVGGEGVVGETQNRLVLYLACLTSALDKVVSVLVKGPSSTGKSNLTKTVLSLVPPEKLLTRSSFSKKTFAYTAEELAGKVLYLVEHRGGEDAAFYRRLLQSEGELHHEVTIGSGTQVTSHIGAPVFISTTTDERVYEDDETRFLSIRADESAELTREVVRVQFKEKRKEKK
jgi:energy-coupling factor transporter ATP-binding protein EcfA2